LISVVTVNPLRRCFKIPARLAGVPERVVRHRQEKMIPGHWGEYLVRFLQRLQSLLRLAGAVERSRPQTRVRLALGPGRFQQPDEA
jgi:hypothetical protein